MIERGSRRRRQLGGALIALFAAACTAWSWDVARRQGYVYLHAGVLFPACFVLGIGVVLFPGYKEERLARGEDISQLSGAQLLTPRWWVVFWIAMAAGVVNYILLRTR